MHVRNGTNATRITRIRANERVSVKNRNYDCVHYFDVKKPVYSTSFTYHIK